MNSSPPFLFGPFFGAEGASEETALATYCEGFSCKYTKKPRSEEAARILYKFTIYGHACSKTSM